MGDLFPAVSFGHTGFTGTSIAVDPETGLYAVLLTNAVHIKRSNPDVQRFRRLFHNRVYAAAFK
jgi:CubicO group peptidase (beta-lactamase class C family)